MNPSPDDGLRAVLERLSPRGRDALRQALIRDEPDRDAIATELLHYGDEAGNDWADIIDALTLHPDQRRRLVQLLGEIEAHGALRPAQVRASQQKFGKRRAAPSLEGWAGATRRPEGQQNPDTEPARAGCPVPSPPLGTLSWRSWSCRRADRPVRPGTPGRSRATSK